MRYFSRMRLFQDVIMLAADHVKLQPITRKRPPTKWKVGVVFWPCGTFLRQEEYDPSGISVRNITAESMYIGVFNHLGTAKMAIIEGRNASPEGFELTLEFAARKAER